MGAPIKLVLEVAAGLAFIFAATQFVSGENRVRVIAVGLAAGVAALIF